MCYLLAVRDGSGTIASFTARLSAFGDNREPGWFPRSEVGLPIHNTDYPFIVAAELPAEIDDIHAVTLRWVRTLPDLEDFTQVLTRAVEYVASHWNGEMTTVTLGSLRTKVNELATALSVAQRELESCAVDDQNRTSPREIDLLDQGSGSVCANPAWVAGRTPPVRRDPEGRLAEFARLELPAWFKEMTGRPHATFLCGVFATRERRLLLRGSTVARDLLAPEREDGGELTVSSHRPAAD